MINDLEQFSEERLIEISRFKQASELAALARIALAAKQAKPVAITDRAEIAGLSEAGWVGNFMATSYKGVDKGDEVWLYTTPQPAHTEQDGWIKCSERMPGKSDEYYMTYSTAGVDVTYFSGRFQDEYATHWMPLPAAPKPESE